MVTMSKKTRKTSRKVLHRKDALKIQFITASFSLPTEIVDAVREAAFKRPDYNKSAVVTEALAAHFGIPLDEGGEPEKQTIPA